MLNPGPDGALPSGCAGAGGKEMLFSMEGAENSHIVLLVFRVQVPVKVLGLSDFPGYDEKCMSLV